MHRDLTAGERIASGDEGLAQLILLSDSGYLEGQVGDDEESQEFARKVRALNPDLQPGEVPKVPKRPMEHPDRTAWRERLIRHRGAWAYTPDGTLKPDWLLAMGPKAWEAQQRKNMEQMLRGRARLAQLRRDGYWFDDPHRLQAPVQVPGRRVQVAARGPRRSTRSSSAKARAPGSSSDENPPPLRVIDPAEFSAYVERCLAPSGLSDVTASPADPSSLRREERRQEVSRP